MMSEKLLRMFSRKTPRELFFHIGANQEGQITYQTQIATKFGMPNSTLNGYITKFKEEGLIEGLKLTQKGKKVFMYLWKNSDKTVLRAHNIQITLNLSKCPSGFPDCFSNKIYQPISNKRYKGIKVELNGMTLMFYSPKKIVCVLPDIFADTDEEISSQVQLLVTDIIKIVEEEFKGVKIGGHDIAKIQTMDVAVLNSVIAKAQLIKGFTRENEEFAIDCSHEIPEVELTSPSNALRDIKSLLKLEEHYKKETKGDKKIQKLK